MDLQKLFSWIFQTTKAFDCIDPNLRIAKLHAYGLSVDALGRIYDYLSNRKIKSENKRFIQLVE